MNISKINCIRLRIVNCNSKVVSRMKLNRNKNHHTDLSTLQEYKIKTIITVLGKSTFSYKKKKKVKRKL